MSQNKNKVTLDFIREAADKKYANLTIDVAGTEVTLVNAMQLPKDKRDELMAAQKRLSAAKDEAEAAEGEGAEAPEVDQVAALEDTLRIVVKGGKADALIEAIDGNLAVLATVFEMYTKGTELGEASASAN